MQVAAHVDQTRSLALKKLNWLEDLVGGFMWVEERGQSEGRDDREDGQ